MSKTKQPISILETALYVDDLDAAEGFFGGLLELERVSRAGNRSVFYRCGAGMLLVFNPEETRVPSGAGIPVPVHGASGAGHVCFSASNEEIETWRDRLQAAGVEIEQDFTWPNGARSLYVRDPAGNSIEFAEPQLWGFKPP